MDVSVTKSFNQISHSPLTPQVSLSHSSMTILGSGSARESSRGPLGVATLNLN